jgi:spermidine/putrescine transport system substrate-binding protein
VDFGKEEMTKGKAWMNVSWSGDAQWAIDEANNVGV